MWGFTFSRLAHFRGGRQRGSNQQDKPGFPRKKSIIRGTMGGFVRQNREDWMRLQKRWRGLICSACLALLIVICRYCCTEMLLEVIVLFASYHQKVFSLKKKVLWLTKLKMLSKAKYRQGHVSMPGAWRPKKITFYRRTDNKWLIKLGERLTYSSVSKNLTFLV